MSNDLASKYAMEFISEMYLGGPINLDEPFDIKLKEEHLKADPNFEILNKKLKEEGYMVKKYDTFGKYWIISKI